MTTTGVVYVVDDDASFRTAVSRMLIAAGLSVRSYGSGAEFLADLSRNTVGEDTGCVLADLCMPGIDGLKLQEECGAAGVTLPFVFLTGHGDVPSAVSAMRHGAVDFLDKCAPRHTVLGALERAMECDTEARTVRAVQEQLKVRFATLTAREVDVLALVVRGKMNKQIAAALGIHERTVKLHRNSITTKLAVRSVAELTTLTRQAGLFEESK